MSKRADMPDPLRNAYFALRHGRSEANERGIVVARLESACAGFGLSAAGRAEVRASVAPERLRAHGVEPERALVVSSDFLRARETAELLCAENGLVPPRLDARLRERWFGGLEGGSTAGYGRIWARDREDPDHEDLGCESVAAVLARLVSLVRDLEREHGGRGIVLVSHGDPLQVLETAFRGLRPGEHRSLRPLATAELRRLG